MNIEATTGQLDRRRLLAALRAFRRGDFSVRLTEDHDGIDGEIAQTFNEIVEINQQITGEFERLSLLVGKDGRIAERGNVRNATGGWESSVRSVNELIQDMVQPVRRQHLWPRNAVVI